MTHIRQVSRELWIPGRDVAVDEAMSRFEGRSYDIVTIPGKPIPEGYKIWVLAQQGYFLDWVFHRKGIIKNPIAKGGPRGPWKVTQPRELGDNNSSAVVAHLMASLPNQGKGFLVYLDNLFTNVKLLRYGRERGWGATGTCTAKSGILKRFCDMKKEDTRKDAIPWGTLHAEPTEDEKINMFAWKDNALVLFMSTAEDGEEEVESERKRPSETSTSAKTARAPFKGQARAWLNIPAFDYRYNHGMNAVDRGNQLKKQNSVARKIKLGGHHSLVDWSIDTTLVNAYKLSFHSDVPDKDKWTDQEEFRTAIFRECLRVGRESRTKRKRSASTSMSPILGLPTKEHTLERRAYAQDCVVCKKEGVSRAVKRRVLGELSTNVLPNTTGSGCRKSSRFGCKICNIPLCKDSTCFARYHSLE